MKLFKRSKSYTRTNRKISRWEATVALIAVSFVGMAITATAQAPASKRTVIRAGRVLNVRTGELRANQALVIEGDKISQIAPSTDVNAAAGDTTIDLPDATLLPGLIDMHTHLTFELSSLSYEGLKISTAREALHGARNARRTLEAGFTTVRNVGAKDYADIALRDAINDGDVIGPRMVASGPALGITGGHCDENLLPPAFHFFGEGVADGVEAVQHKVREVIKYGADVIKICATGGVLSKGDDPNASQYTLEEMKAIVADAHRLARRVAAHAHGAEGVRWASEAGVDSIEHGHLMDDAAVATLKKNGTYLVPTLFLGEYMEKNLDRSDVAEYSKQKMRDVAAAMQKNVKKAFDAGVKVAFGTDAAVYPHGLNAGEFHVYVKLGMTPLAAIQTATINASDLLGPKYLVGALEPGKWADMIDVDGDPTKDVTILEHVKCVIAVPRQKERSPEERKENQQRTLLVEMHREAQTFFVKQLEGTLEGKAARAYLEDRGLDKDAIARFGIGYAPSGGDALLRQLKSKYNEKLLAESGLVSRDQSSGKLFDRFRRRITFPIANESGKIVAFGARALGDDMPKYLNSPETPIYSKSNVLYHMDRAKEGIRRQEFAILVEGYMDAIAVERAGISNVVASCGTSLAEPQIKLLQRFTKRVIVNYDTDMAGQTATERSLALLLEQDFEVRVLALPPVGNKKADPDLFIREMGAEAYLKLLKEAPPYVDYLIA